MRKLTVQIRGMHCKSCEILIEKNVGGISGVHSVYANYRLGIAEIRYKGHDPATEDISSAVREAGYELGASENAPWLSTDDSDYKGLLLGGVILTGLY